MMAGKFFKLIVILRGGREKSVVFVGKLAWLSEDSGLNEISQDENSAIFDELRMPFRLQIQGSVDFIQTGKQTVWVKIKY